MGFVDSLLKPNVCTMEERGMLTSVPLHFMGFAIEPDCIPTLMNHSAMNRVRAKLIATVHRQVSHL